jgi:hypothetical protein
VLLVRVQVVVGMVRRMAVEEVQAEVEAVKDDV